MSWPEWLQEALYRARLLAARGRGACRIAAGTNELCGPFEMVVDAAGTVSSRGGGAYGVLGHGDEEPQPELKVVEALRGKKVVQISLGDFHGVVLLEGGKVVTFGRGKFGRLGHGDTQGQLLPRVVEALLGKEVLQVSAGLCHSMALLESGEVLTFGTGGSGQLGHGDEQAQLLPRVVEALQGKKVVQISAGGAHSMVLLEGGAVLRLGAARPPGPRRHAGPAAAQAGRGAAGAGSGSCLRR